MMKNEAGVRIEEMLCQLADATRIDGEIWRAAYTLEDKIAKNILREWIEDLGLEYREDAIGNVYGRLPGTEPGTILTGSHLDTVKNGGKYDGALGVVTGVAALGQRPAHRAGRARYRRGRPARRGAHRAAAPRAA